MPEELPIVDGLIALDHFLEKAFEEITNRFPNWNYRVDERLLYLVKLRNVASCGKLALILNNTSLKDAAWWKSVQSQVSDFDQHPKRDLEFDVFTRFAMFQGLFSLYEAALRSLTAALTGSVPDKLYQVRAAIFQRLPSLSLGDKDVYFDLTRFVGTIRNCIHNNMVHMGNDLKLSYRSDNFEFKRGRPPGFLSWHVFIHVAYDLARMFRALVLTPEISRLPPVASFVDFKLYGQAEPT